MNKRVEILKKAAESAKRKKVPKKLIVLELTIMLLMMHIGQGIYEIIKKIFDLLFPSKTKVLICVMLGIILGFFVLPHNHTRIDDEKAYGNVVEIGSEKIDEDIEKQDLASNGEVVFKEKLNETNVKEYETKKYSEEELLNMSFYIKVNRLMNCITIYTTDKQGDYTVPVKAMICSTGNEDTPLGIYNTQEKYVFRRLLYDVYGQYATRIFGQILFHSASYTNGYKDTLIAEEFNKLGSSASHGCIRLTTEDAKWIYDYCKIGTTVEIYEDDNPGPLGKPEMIKIPEDSVWDPTDVDPANPWNNYKPNINADNMIISVGGSIDFFENVTAFDTCGNDITDKLLVIGNVDTDTEGMYKVTYRVTDLIGRSTEKTICIEVKGNEINGNS